MNKNSIVIGIIVIAVLVIGYLSWQGRKSDVETPEVVPDGTETTTDDEGNVSSEYEGAVLAGSIAPLLDFKQADYEKALASDKLVVLYFYANWCPICKQETTEALQPFFNELTDPNVIGFRVNYFDNEMDADERALAEEFGITYQHTKVLLQNGEQVLKAPDSWTKDRYVEEVEKALGA